MSLRGLRRLTQLSWHQRRILLRAYVWLGMVDLSLRVIGFRRLVALAPAARDAPSARVPGHVGWYASWIELAARHHPVPAYCLHKSLVLHFWLRREGLPSQLRIGVRKADGELRAHAWVELSGSVVNDDPQAVAAFRPLSAPHIEGMVWNRRTMARPVGALGLQA